MNLRGRELRQGMSGAEVKLLHAELQKLGYSIARLEVDQSYFGQSTEKAVRAFQAQQHLPLTGISGQIQCEAGR